MKRSINKLNVRKGKKQQKSIIERGKGTYILIFHLSKDNILQIGKLGHFDFPSGFYTYVGSAFGPGGLAGRLKHHLSSNSHPHWHIDYIRKAARLDQIWLSEQEIPREHDWAALMSQMEEAKIPVTGFGCSDCKCETHLFYFEEQPDMQEFQRLAGKQFPNDAPLRLVVSRLN